MRKIRYTILPLILFLTILACSGGWGEQPTPVPTPTPTEEALPTPTPTEPPPSGAESEPTPTPTSSEITVLRFEEYHHTKDCTPYNEELILKSFSLEYPRGYQIQDCEGDPSNYVVFYAGSDTPAQATSVIALGYFFHATGDDYTGEAAIEMLDQFETVMAASLPEWEKLDDTPLMERDQVEVLRRDYRAQEAGQDFFLRLAVLPNPQQGQGIVFLMGEQIAGGDPDTKFARLDTISSEMIQTFEFGEYVVAAPTPEPLQPAESMLIAVGGGDNRVSVLNGDEWIRPEFETKLRSCMGLGAAFFDPSGTPWVACHQLYRWTEGSHIWQEVAPDLSFGDQTVMGPQGRIWWIDSEQISLVEPASGEIIETYQAMEATGEENFPTETVAFGSDGSIWLGGRNIKGSCLVSFDGDSWQAYGGPEEIGLKAHEAPRLVYVEDGELQVVVGSGIYTLEDNSLVPLIEETINGLSTANDMLFHPDGSLWLASFNGIVIWDGSSWENIGREEGLPAKAVYDLALDEAGRVWAATQYGLAWQADSGSWQVALPGNSDIAESEIRAIAVRGRPTMPPPADTAAQATVSGRILLDGDPLADTPLQICSETPALFFFDKSPCEDHAVALLVKTETNGEFEMEIPLGTFKLTVYNPVDEEWKPFIFTRINALKAGQSVQLGDIELAE